MKKLKVYWVPLQFSLSLHWHLKSRSSITHISDLYLSVCNCGDNKMFSEKITDTDVECTAVSLCHGLPSVLLCFSLLPCLLFNLGEKLHYAFSGFHSYLSTNLLWNTVNFKDYVCFSLSVAFAFFPRPYRNYRTCPFFIYYIVMQVLISLEYINPPMIFLLLASWVQLSQAEGQTFFLDSSMLSNVSSLHLCVWLQANSGSFSSSCSQGWDGVLILAPFNTDRKWLWLW